VQFRRGSIEDTVAQALADSGLAAARLELELTESILIQDVEQVMATVQRLKLLGVQLAIDDFGTGYSSLSYLKRFDIDKLKIDRSFVRDLGSDPDDAAIVRAIIQMAHSLGCGPSPKVWKAPTCCSCCAISVVTKPRATTTHAPCPPPTVHGIWPPRPTPSPDNPQPAKKRTAFMIEGFP
jgi:hypothetical protein